MPPLPFNDGTFDFVISFQVIEHIKQDTEFVREVHRVLRPSGKFIVTTPNAPMSLTRNPWHVREYRAEELCTLLQGHFAKVETLGVSGNDRVMEYYERNREGVRRITRFDIFDLQLPSATSFTPNPLRSTQPFEPQKITKAEQRTDDRHPDGRLRYRAGR